MRVAVTFSARSNTEHFWGWWAQELKPSGTYLARPAGSHGRRPSGEFLDHGVGRLISTLPSTTSRVALRWGARERDRERVSGRSMSVQSLPSS
jgi:hypothetical protein